MTDLPERSLVRTADGSWTLFVPQWDEHYHSIHGAVQESMHVFIRAGLEPLLQKGQPIRILEIGMGTGLNVWLTLLESLKSSVQVHYTTLEAYPLKEEEWAALEYPSEVAEANTWFQKIHQSPWEAEVALTENFTLKKCRAALESWQSEGIFDLIYFDAFAPSAQPELWTEDIFARIRAAASPGAVLTTYCAKGSVKRAMKAAGWEIEALAGPPGKREMTRAFLVPL